MELKIACVTYIMTSLFLKAIAILDLTNFVQQL